MSEEKKLNEENEKQENDNTVVTIRKGEYEGLKTQISQFKSQMTELEKLKNQMKEKEDKEKQSQLVAQGKYEESLALLQEQLVNANKEKEELANSYKEKEMTFNVTNELAKLGVTNKRFLQSVVADYLSMDEKPSVVDYIEMVKAEEDSQVFFNNQNQKVTRPGDFVSSQKSPSQDLANIAKDLGSLNKADMAKARSKFQLLNDDQKQKVLEMANQN
jgi:hypothetical protein